MSLKDRVTEDMKAAMRARETARLSTIRLLLAAIKQKEVDERVVVGDADVLSLIEKMIKQRRESIAQYEKGGRADLAAAEQAELTILAAYLPAQLTPEEVDAAIAAAVTESGASGVKDMGKVMGLLKGRLAGRTDMGALSARVKASLGG